jgi:hypothetical protein
MIWIVKITLSLFLIQRRSWPFPEVLQASVGIPEDAFLIGMTVLNPDILLHHELCRDYSPGYNYCAMPVKAKSWKKGSYYFLPYDLLADRD